MRVASSVPGSVRTVIKEWVPEPVWRGVRDATVSGERRVNRAVSRARTRGVRARFARGWPGRSAIEVHGLSYAARHVSRFRSSEVLAEHLAFVADARERAEVPYFVLDAEPERRRVVVVAATHRGRALAALQDAADDDVWYAARVREGAVEAARVLGRQPIWRREPVLRVFRVSASPSGGFLGGPTLGCDIEFWSVVRTDRPAYYNGEPVPAGTIIAPRPNRWADIIVPDELETRQQHVDGTPRPVLASIRHPHVFLLREPVDAVYTWVDGQDPTWIARKAETLAARGESDAALHALATNDSRFVSRDELRYSMRSLDMYADWIRHVYLVTDDQTPYWLDTSNPRVTVVSHREIFGDAGRLPTFNSHAIESRLHRVPGLSEHYLYLNDDVFFGRPVSPSLFFHGNGVAVFNPSKAKIGLGEPTTEDAPVMSAAKHNRDLLAAAFGVTVSNKMQHVPHALRRSVLEDMERDFAEEFAGTASNQFRSPEDLSIPSSLAHYYGYLTGRSIPGRLRYFYADIARHDTPDRLAELLAARDYDVFCLNDHDSSRLSPEEQARIVNRFLEAYFPLPSSFEKQ